MNIATLETKLKEEYDLDWTIGISTLLSPHDPVEGINKLIEADLEPGRIEIALAKQLDDEEKIIKRLKKLKRKKDLRYSVHTPFLYDDLAHPKDRIRQIHLDEGRKAIDLAARLEARHIVFHPGEFFFRQNLPPLELFKPFRNSRESYLKNSEKSLTSLSRHGSSLGVNLLIENLPHGLCDRPEEIKYLLPKIENSNFILDIGHANISGSLKELLDLEPGYFHFNDNNGKTDNHRRLGKGSIDLRWLISRLRDYGGDKTIIFELYSLEDVLSSLETFEDALES